jgi:hypothetical protein
VTFAQHSMNALARKALCAMRALTALLLLAAVSQSAAVEDTTPSGQTFDVLEFQVEGNKIGRAHV